VRTRSARHGDGGRGSRSPHYAGFNYGTLGRNVAGANSARGWERTSAECRINFSHFTYHGASRSAIRDSRNEKLGEKRERRRKQREPSSRAGARALRNYGIRWAAINREVRYVSRM